MKDEQLDFYPNYEEVDPDGETYKNIREYAVPDTEFYKKIKHFCRQLVALLRDNGINTRASYHHLDGYENQLTIRFNSHCCGKDVEKIDGLLLDYGFSDFKIEFYSKNKEGIGSGWGDIVFEGKKMEYMPLNYVPPKTNGKN